MQDGGGFSGGLGGQMTGGKNWSRRGAPASHGGALLLAALSQAIQSATGSGCCGYDWKRSCRVHMKMTTIAAEVSAGGLQYSA
jgi:hypothetical protein